jgi:hypothetical protein
MSMYVGYLSDAVQAWHGDRAGESLVDYAVMSRVDMLSSRLEGSPSAYDLLAAEIAYDLSLILLCHDLGISTGAADFADPLSERSRLERALLESWGLDLCALSRARCQV